MKFLIDAQLPRRTNISNDALNVLISPLLGDIVREFQTANFIELSRDGLVVRG